MRTASERSWEAAERPGVVLRLFSVRVIRIQLDARPRSRGLVPSWFSASAFRPGTPLL